MSSTPVKRKRLTIMEKVYIIKRVEGGERQIDLAAEHGVAHSVISRIMKEKENIIDYFRSLEQQQGNCNKKKMDHLEDSPVEKAIFQWFVQQMSLGNPVSGPILREKALDFNKKLNGPPSFQASDGWLTRFKSRHRIRMTTMKNEKMSTDADPHQLFREDFNNYLKDMGFDLDNVYNADETALAWKSLPRRTFLYELEKKISTYEVPKDHVTIITCANATGTHKIPLLVIGESVKSQSFKNILHLPVEYRCEKNAWINKQLFEDWFVNIFIPTVKERKSGESERFLLLLDNAPSHPPLDRLNSIHPNFTVFYLPFNVTTLLQPMNQGVIDAMKNEYRKRFLQRLLMQEIQDKESVASFTKKWSLLNCCKSVANAWNTVSSFTLQHAWNKLLYENTVEVYENQSLHEIAVLFNRLPIGSDFSIDELSAWLKEDSAIPTCRVLSDEDIVHLHNGNLSSIDEIVEELVKQEQEDENEDEQGLEKEEQQTAFDVVKALDKISTWCERHYNYDDRQIRHLQEIQDLTLHLAIDDLLQKPSIKKEY